MKLNFDVTYKQFSIFFVCLMFFTLGMSFFLFRLELVHSVFNRDNRLILQYQMDKMKNNLDNLNTAIVGDSSAGNAIDAVYFSELGAVPTQNFALTGSFGFVGTFEMMNRIVEKNPQLKNIVIIQTLDIWKRPFSKESIFELGNLQLLNIWSHFFSRNAYFEYLEYSMKVKNILELVRYSFEKTFIYRRFFDQKKHASIDVIHDYLMQNQETYANKNLLVDENKVIELNINSRNLEILHIMDKWCFEKHLHCFYLHGPVHETIFKNSTFQIQNINQSLVNFENIKIFPQVLFYKNEKMGDNVDHVDVQFKKQSTQDYFELLKTSLVK